MAVSLINDMLNAEILKAPEPPRDSWALGTVVDEPSDPTGWHTVTVLIDGDTTATTMRYCCPCTAGNRVLTLLLGRSRIVVGNLDVYVPS